MIELLGVGVPRSDGGWLLHRVCATLEAGEVTVVLASRAEERQALLDTITGRRLPDEGRAWIGRVPLMRASMSRIRGLAADVNPAVGLVERRSLFWNVLAPASGPRAIGRLLRLPRRRERRAAMAALEAVGLRARADEPVAGLAAFDRLRFLVARALARRPRYLVVREPDLAIGRDAVDALLGLLRRLARADRLGVVVSLGDGGEGLSAADRVLLLGDGLLFVPWPGRRAGRGGIGLAGGDGGEVTAGAFFDLVGLFAGPGQRAYGESVSQLDHALQCAALARQDRADDEVVIAALLHDVGHLVESDHEDEAHHHGTGGAALVGAFAPARVVWLIEHHVVAKRYLCTVDPPVRRAALPGVARVLCGAGGPARPRRAAGAGDAAVVRRRRPRAALGRCREAAGCCVSAPDRVRAADRANTSVPSRGWPGRGSIADERGRAGRHRGPGSAWRQTSRCAAGGWRSSTSTARASPGSPTGRW